MLFITVIVVLSFQTKTTIIIEDAVAQTFGKYGCISFHQLKIYMLLWRNDILNDNSLFDEAKYIYEKGHSEVIAGNKQHQWVKKVHPFKYLVAYLLFSKT